MCLLPFEGCFRIFRTLSYRGSSIEGNKSYVNFYWSNIDKTVFCFFPKEYCQFEYPKILAVLFFFPSFLEVQPFWWKTHQEYFRLSIYCRGNFFSYFFLTLSLHSLLSLKHDLLESQFILTQIVWPLNLIGCTFENLVTVDSVFLQTWEVVLHANFVDKCFEVTVEGIGFLIGGGVFLFFWYFFSKVGQLLFLCEGGSYHFGGVFLEEWSFEVIGVMVFAFC